MNNIVRFSINPPSIFLIDQKMCYVDYIGLRWFGHSLTAVFCFGNLFGNFFRSITQSSIRSIRLRSIQSVFKIDQIFSVDHAFGWLELYVFGQDWPKAIQSTQNLVNKGPMINKCIHQATTILKFCFRSSNGDIRIMSLDQVNILERILGNTKLELVRSWSKIFNHPHRHYPFSITWHLKLGPRVYLFTFNTKWHNT